VKGIDNKRQKSNKASIPVRAVLVSGLFVFAIMLTIGVFFPETPLSPSNLRGASGSTSATGGAPEMLWVVIPLWYWGSYRTAKIVIREIKEKKKRNKT